MSKGYNVLLYLAPVCVLAVILLSFNSSHECHCPQCGVIVERRTEEHAEAPHTQVEAPPVNLDEPAPFWINPDMEWAPYSEKAPCHNVTAIVPGQIHGDQLFSFAVKYYNHAKFVETGVLFGQGSAYIASLVKDAQKDIKLYSLDVYIWWSWMNKLVGSWQRQISGNSFVGQPGCSQASKDVRNGWASDIARVRKEMNLHTDTLPMVEYFWRRAGLYHNIAAGKMDSIIGAAFFSSKSLAFVYLDTDHTYFRTLAEIQAWWPKVAVGGTLSGDDFSDDFDGVRRAVRACFGDATAISYNTNPPQWAVQKGGPGIKSHQNSINELLCMHTEHKFQEKPFLKQQFVGDVFIGS